MRNAAPTSRPHTPSAKTPLSRLLPALLSCLGPAAVAQSPSPEPTDLPGPQPYRLPTIIVTGELLPATSPHSDASSVSLLTGTAAREHAIHSTRDLGTLTPNLAVFDANGDRVPRLSIRGLRDNNFSVGEPSVALYIDDVPYNDLSSRGVPFHDVDQIDFLRGPQGTLFGASRPGGVIQVLTRLPSNDCRGIGMVEYGSYDHWSGEAAASGPVAKDHLFFNVSGIYDVRDGFMDNDYLGTHPDTRETFAGRAALRYTPSDSLDITLAISGELFNDGAVAIGPIDQPDPFQFDRDFDGYVDTRSLTESLRVAYTASRFKVISVTVHRDWQQDLLQDFDFSTTDLVRGFTNPEIRQWSQELRVQSPDDTEHWRWVAGGFFSSREQDTDSGSRYTGIPVPFPPFFLDGPFVDRTTAEFSDQNYALFGQATWMGIDRLELTAGLRWDYDDRSIDRSRVSETEALFGAPPIPDQSLEDTFNSLQPRGALAYHAATNITVFGSITRGYQSGGFHASSDLPGNSAFDEMTSWHSEVGARTKWFNRRLGLNLSLFRGDYDDYQVYRPVTATQFAILNADRATAMGAELEAVLQPIPDLRIQASLGYTHAEFNRFADPLNGATFDGNTVNFVPEFTWNAGARYQFPHGFFARVDGQGVGQFYLDEANSRSQSPYALLHARVGWENTHFGLALFGRNLTDETYTANAINFRDPASNADFFVGSPGHPRMLGVAGFVKF